MSIRFSKYVDITSAVEGASQIRERQLILRVFSTNPLIPTNSFAEFFDADEVGAYFNTTSAEYLVAQKYFGFISKNATQPHLISYSSWVDADVAPNIFGSKNATDTLAQFNGITSGSLNLTIGALTHLLTAINLSAAGSLAAVATDIQTAIRTQSGTPDWATATVTYNSGTGAFDLTGGVVPTSGTVPIACLPTGGGVDVGVALGWQDVLTITSYGSAAVSLTDTMIASVSASNNFGTFYFIPTLDQDQIVELATWLSTTDPNVEFMFLVPVTSSNATALSNALFNFPGVAMTLSPIAHDYPELFPGMILAATNYDNRNASQNYMFQQSDFTPSVTSDADSDAYDLLRVNYYGETQTAGQQISFYQRGVLTGLATSPTDMNVYANEMWFKNAMGDMFMNLLLALTEIPANNNGRAILLTGAQSVIAQALFNGTISVGNPLSQVQIATIGSLTGDANAWRQINTIGYWIDFEFTSIITQDSRTEYQATYTLVYTKNNAIRKVVGSHILI